MCHLLLCVIVTRKPPCHVVAGHRELGHLLLDEEVIEFLLLWELVAETDTVIKHTEDEVHHSAMRFIDTGQPFVVAFAFVFGACDDRYLFQVHDELSVVVTNGLRLAPDGLPGLVCLVDGGVNDVKAVHQVGLLEAS